ncbi:hypothetical protein G6F56_003691 [Rhizopus delemar]|nr:hypothetical protein G6F56_003691 [Rhizopus delemar]
MSINTSTNLKEPEWPPEFSQYIDQDLTESNVVAILEREARNKKAPEAYKEFFVRLTKHYRSIINKMDKDEKTMQQLQSSCDKYTHYVSVARENYESLSELYQEQYTHVLELEETQLQKSVAFEAEKKRQEQTAQDLRLTIAQLNSQKENIVREFEQFKVESDRNAKKQGVGRRNLENTLFEKEKQILDTKRTINELQVHLKQKTKEIDDANAKYRAITTLLQGSRQVSTSL